MKAIEFIYEARNLFELKQLGRTFNHLEDLVFFYGAAGVKEALDHLREITQDKGSTSIRMKWDGKPTVYWGREVAGGPLLVTGTAGWGRNVKLDSAEELYNFIATGTKAAGPAREQFAKLFASLYAPLDAATPKDFVGFVYGDLMFSTRPELDNNGIYNFCPNENSGTCYHVSQDSDLGKRISQADAMIVGHAYYPEYGMNQNDQQPIDDFSQFNNTAPIIVLGPVYNKKPIKVDTSAIDQADKYVSQHGKNIDTFIAGVKGLSDVKEIIYKYVNQTAKARQLDKLSSKHFYQWLANSTVSQPKQAKIQELDQAYNNVTEEIFTLVKIIQVAKNSVIDQLEDQEGEIWDTKGEGHVRYGDDKKQFGNVKFVPRHKWQPGI